jgi:beta-N-acetylhexosaminidase
VIGHSCEDAGDLWRNARTEAEDMSELDRLVNSWLLPGFAGPVLPEWTADALADDLAGICVYGAHLPREGGAGRAVAGPAAAVRTAVPDALVALDEEGGDVTRLDYRPGSRCPGTLALGVADDEALAEQVGAAIGGDLRRAGVTVDFAPSVGVNSDPRNPVIGVRSFGADPALVARHGAARVCTEAAAEVLAGDG